MSRRVLIADDSAVTRAAIVQRIRTEGIDVVEEESAAGASSVDTTDLACALLDLDLGDGFGTEVAGFLRREHGHLPIAFFTSSSEPEMLVRAATYGPVFAKPDDLDRAVEWIRRHGR